MTHAPKPERTPHEVTCAVRAGIDRDAAFGAVVPPLVLSSNFSFAGFGKPRAHDYTRSGNPTRDVLAGALAELEGGAGAVITSSGMSAVALVLDLLRPGDRVVAAHDGYGGTHRLLSALSSRGAFHVDFVDLTAADAPQAIAARRPTWVWVETPSNPLLRLTDLSAVCAAAAAVGAKVAADNTFLSPARQKPLAFGADVVVHSTTKYLNGHSDVVGGAVVARDAALLAELAWWANARGVAGAPFDAFLTLRGLRTLHLRVDQAERNAAALAHAAERHDAVQAVHWPGLASHPQRALALRQQKGPGPMLSLSLRGGLEAARAFSSGLTSFTLAESLGGVESLVAHPATMTHASMDPDARRKAGIDDGVVRISPGVEHEDDLVADLVRALDRAGASLAKDRGPEGAWAHACSRESRLP